MRAVILAGGRGVRLAPYTELLPKPLIPVGGIPILQIILLQLRNAGFSRVTLSVHYKADLIEQYFGDGDWLGLRIDYCRESSPLGTAGPLSLVDSLDQTLDETFLVMNADILTSIEFADVFASHMNSGALASAVLHSHNIHIDYGVAELDTEHRIMRYVEKPNLRFLVSAGIYVFEATVLEYIPPEECLDMPELLRKLMGHGHPINAYLFEGEWCDIGTISQYQGAQDRLSRHRGRYLRDGDNCSVPSRPATPEIAKIGAAIKTSGETRTFTGIEGYL